MIHEDINEDATIFLRGKGLLNPEYSKFIIQGQFGKVDLAEIMMEFAMWYKEEYDSGEYGRKDY